MNNRHRVIFVRPCFLEGVARILDFGDRPAAADRSLPPEERDALALESDLRAVAADIRAGWATAVDEFDRTLAHAQEEPGARRTREPAGPANREP